MDSNSFRINLLHIGWYRKLFLSKLASKREVYYKLQMYVCSAKPILNKLINIVGYDMCVWQGIQLDYELF